MRKATFIVAVTALVMKCPNVEAETIQLVINGKKRDYAPVTSWRDGIASKYDQDSETSWCDGRTEEKRWSWFLQRFVDAHFPHRHFRWDGWCNKHWFQHRNWHNFRSFKDEVPACAHRHHEVGTFVMFRHSGKDKVALVVDHGPYIGGRDWDLDPALARAINFNGVGKVEYQLLAPR